MTQLRRPLVAALVAFLAGLIPSIRFGPDPTFIGVGLALLVASRLLPRTDEPGSSGHRRGFDRRITFVALFVLSGAFSGSLARQDSLSDCRRSFADDQQLEIRGRLAAAHRRPTGSGGSPLLPLLVTEVEGTAACSGEIRVRIPARIHELTLGSEVTIVGKWRLSRFAGDPRTDAWPSDPRFSGFVIADSVRIESDAPAPPLWLRMRAHTDERLERIFSKHLPLVEALLLGRREYVDPAIRDRYARSGLAHLLAISGMHVGLLAAALLLFASAIRLSRKRAIHFTLVAIWVYLIVIGAPPSAIRAGTMISLGLLAVLLQRPAAPTAIMATAAFAILAFDPLTILDPGFQLSFTGVLGILLLRPMILTLTPDQLQRQGPLRGLTDATVVGIGAFLMTAPIVAHHFGVIAPISIVAGLPAVPVMSLALIGAATALVIDPVLPGLAALIASGTSTALDLLDWIAKFAASVPYGNGFVSRPPWWSWTVAAVAGIAAANLPRRASHRLRRIWGIGATVVVLVAWPILLPDSPGGLEVHFIDVGQGDAIAIRTPGNRWVLVDTGPAANDFDAGERIVLPYLRQRGARRLDALVLTHPDMDHIGGAAAILSSIPVSYVFEPGVPAGKNVYLDLLRSLESRQVEWRAARTGRTLQLDGVQLDFLWPDPEAVLTEENANEISAVLHLTYGDFTMLLTGDAGVVVEELLVRRHGEELDVDVLKLGHHGSQTSTSARFLDTVRPDLAVVSAGRRNRYGHPSPTVMARVEQRAIPVARTDLDGDIALVVSEDGLEWFRRD